MNPLPKPEPIPSVRLRWFGQTDRGKIRANNEDSFLCLQFDAREVHRLGKTGDALTGENDYVFAVSDGMGGASAGEFASRITVERITDLLPRSFKHSVAGIAAGFGDVLGELFDQIHRTLMHYGGSYAECSGMGATLSLCWFTPGWMYFGHIGDSRIYYLSGREDGIRRVTDDDTHVGWLFRNAQINEREARQHPRRNILQKALGAGHQFVDPQVGAIGYEPGDKFLLCTDGLVDGLYDSQLAELIRSHSSADAANPVEHIIRAALEASGRDNTTALIVEVH